MKTLRIVGALFWLGCGWCAGDAACRNARRHLEVLEETLLLLQRVRQEIDYRRTDLTLLFRRLEREGAVRGESFQALCPPPGLTRPEQDCYIECFSGIGRAEAGQECQRLTFYQERFRVFLRQAEERTRPQLELCHKLGIAAGLAAASSASEGGMCMEIDLIFKIAAIGIIVAVLNQLLIRSGREDQAMMTTLAGLVVVLSILVKQISVLFVTIKSLFAL